MTSIRRALVYGFFVWLLPFAVAFMVFPFRESNRPLFESIMPVTLGLTVVVLAIAYFRRTSRPRLSEGLALGVVWLLMSVAIDAPLLLFGGPMEMSLGEYLADIGLTYLLIPIITTGMGAAGRLGVLAAAAEAEPPIGDR